MARIGNKDRSVVPRRHIPPQFAAIRRQNALCYKTGKKFLLENEEEIFLIPPAIFKD
jgi:hypothetical protein